MNEKAGALDWAMIQGAICNTTPTKQTKKESEENQDGWMRLSGGRGLHPFLPARTAAPRQLLHPVFAPLDGQVEARAVAPSQ